MKNWEIKEYIHVDFLIYNSSILKVRPVQSLWCVDDSEASFNFPEYISGGFLSLSWN
jgi:hypothetical protein